MKTRKLADYAWIVVFGLFYAFLLLQFSKVFIYYDDYGYLSLSYGNTVPNVAGSEFSFSQLVSFMQEHYYKSNGRLLYMFLFPFIYMFGGLAGVQVFMATSVILLLLLIFYLVKRAYGCKGLRAAALAAFICLLYGTIGIMIQRLGTYWYAASFIYVVPGIVFLLFAAGYFSTARQETREGRLWQKVCCAVTAFLAAFSQEEWLVATIGFILLVWGYRCVQKRKFRLFDGSVMVSALAGSSFILTSPAVRMRMDQNDSFSNLPFLEKVVTNTRNLITLFFSGDNERFLWILLPFLLLMSVYLYWKKRGFQLIHTVHIGATVLLLLYLFLKLKMQYFNPGFYPDIMVIILLLYLALSLWQVIQFYMTSPPVMNSGEEVGDSRVFFCFLFVSAVLTMGCLVVVPELPQRVLLPFIFLSFILIGSVFVRVFAEPGLWAGSLAALAFLCLLSVPNLKNIYTGYRFNYLVHEYNDREIRRNVDLIKQGQKVEEIHLFRLLDPLCSCEMVYDENFSYMIYWMDEFYDLPSEVDLIYDIVSDMNQLIIN